MSGEKKLTSYGKVVYIYFEALWLCYKVFY